MSDHIAATEDVHDDGWEVADEDTEPTWHGTRDAEDLAERDAESWDLGDDAGNEAYTDTEDGPRGPIGDLMATGHGVSVTKPSGLPADMPPCRHCGGPLYPVKVWLCQCTLEVFTLATDTGCRCNWCILNRGGERPPGQGRPRVHCGQPACRKAQRKLDNQLAYRRRKAQVAIQ